MDDTQQTTAFPVEFYIFLGQKQTSYVSLVSEPV